MADPMFGGYAQQLTPQRSTTTIPLARPEDFGAGIGDALMGAGRTAGQISVEQHRLETQREYDRQATDAMVRWARLQEEYGIAENEAKANAAPGAAGFTQDARERADKAGEEFLSSIKNEGLRQAYEQRFADWRGNRMIAADAYERGSTAKQMVTQLDETAGIMANNVNGKPLADYLEAMRDIETMEGPQGVPADALDAWRRDAGQRVTISWMGGQEPEARKAMLDSHQFDALLTPEQVKALGNEADSDIRRKQIEADAAARAARAEALDKIDDVRDRITGGYPVSDAEYAEAVQLAQTIDDKGRLRDLQEGAVAKQVNQEWSRATPAQIDARVKVLDVAIRDKGDKAPASMIAERKALTELLSTRTAQVKSDPLAAGAAMGIRVDPVDWADPASVTARRRAAEATARTLGVPPKYLTDEEAAQLAANVSTPGGRLGVAQQLRQLGPAGAKAAALQVAPGDELFAYSMGLRPEIQQSVFRGEGLTKEFPVAAKDAQPAWREQTGAALARMPAASREAAYQATIALYRQAAARRGETEFNLPLFRGAVREALGGSAVTHSGGVGEWNGAKVLLPPSMTQQQFDARLGSYRPSRAYRGDKSRISGEELRQRFVPIMQPNGKYRFANDRGEYVVVEDGRTPLELDVEKIQPGTTRSPGPSPSGASPSAAPVFVAPPAPDVQGPRSAYEAL